MEPRDIYEFINKNKVFCLATSEGNIPSVRMMAIFKADETGLYFVTDRRKKVFEDLTLNGAVELCFFNTSDNRQVRVKGLVSFPTNTAIREEAISCFPFLKKYSEKDTDNLVVACIRHGVAKPWNFDGITTSMMIDL